MIGSQQKEVGNVKGRSEIIPGIGLGPYRVGMPAGKVLAVLQIPPLESGSFSMYTPYCVSYHDLDRGINIDVDVRIGLCFQIVARAGFSGKTPQGIHINMKSSNALRLDDSLYLDEFYGTLQSKSFPGYYLELEDPDPLPETFGHLLIVGIGVTNPCFFQALEIENLSDLKAVNELRNRMLEYYSGS